MIKRFLILLLIIACTLPGSALAAPPLDLVRQTVNQVLEVLRNPALVGTARRERLSALVRARFDFALMSQWTLGPFWRQADASQKERFITLYSDLLETSYLGKVESYTDEKINFLGEKIDGERAEVETVVATKSADIPLTYRLARQGDDWKVYDVVIEGVSLVRNYRSSFGEIARKDGIDGLLKQLEQKVKAQEADRGRKSG